VSPSIIVLAIVATWAVFLVPRWVRRPQLRASQQWLPDVSEQEDSGWDDEYGADGTDEDDDRSVPYNGGSYDISSRAPSTADDGYPARHQPSAPYQPAPSAGRKRVLQARRRMLTVLVLLAAVAAACTELKLASWWVCVPPVVLLGMYLLLLREAALADAEQARWRAEEARRDFAARQRARAAAAAAAREAAAARVPERTAEIIDISARIGDQLYDQYADATVRAVGD
jgi:hypothetical protein